MEESTEERVERYRRMADSTRDLAFKSDRPEIRDAYLDLAAKWERMAEQFAAEAQPVDLNERLSERRKSPDNDSSPSA